MRIDELRNAEIKYYGTVYSSELRDLQNSIIYISSFGIDNQEPITTETIAKFSDLVGGFQLVYSEDSRLCGGFFDAVVISRWVDEYIVVLAAYVKRYNVLLLPSVFADDREFLDRAIRTIKRMLSSPRRIERALGRLLAKYPRAITRLPILDFVIKGRRVVSDGMKMTVDGREVPIKVEDNVVDLDRYL